MPGCVQVGGGGDEWGGGVRVGWATILLLIMLFVTY